MTAGPKSQHARIVSLTAVPDLLTEAIASKTKFHRGRLLRSIRRAHTLRGLHDPGGHATRVISKR